MDRVITTAAETHSLCPAAGTGEARLARDDMLRLAMPKRMVVQHGVTSSGGQQLTLFYGAKEISFDEPHLFRFGETLARQTRFAAAEALGWGDNLGWEEVRACLLTLLDEGVLLHAGDDVQESAPAERGRPSPLAPARCAEPAHWSDIEAITAKLAGRAIEPAWTELVVPVFRIAHIALDDDGRQVGEANVFPRALRLDRPTEWMACTYAGSRYLDPKPMNVTALKGMRSHWTTMMMALAAIRGACLARFESLSGPLTVGAIERLATLVLAVPTYQLVKPGNRGTEDRLHPALSSLFRVADGLRLVMHQMLFVPAGEPALPPETAVTVDFILDYAERNFAFHSETGVCAGPRHFIRAFLEVLVEGGRRRNPRRFPSNPPSRRRWPISPRPSTTASRRSAPMPRSSVSGRSWCVPMSGSRKR